MMTTFNWVDLHLSNRPSYGNFKVWPINLLFDLVTYLFDLRPKNENLGIYGIV